MEKLVDGNERAVWKGRSVQHTGDAQVRPVK